MRNPNVGVLVFSLIETLGVIVWLLLLRVEVPGNDVLAGVVLFVFYVVEHVVAFNVAKGRDWLQFPLRP